MLVFDGGVLAASGLILFSIATNWYEKGFIVDGARETVTRHLLSGNAGIQRPLLPILAGFTVVEVVLNMRWLRASQRAWRAHRGVVLLLCAVQLVLVVSCMLSSPLWAASLANIGISINAGPGGWIALGGAVIGLLAAVGRAFAGRTALGRSAPLPGRPRGLAGS
ncbi:MAG TPA: hypothetical protein VEH29_03820 [Acidimicrobiales bacterium]|nr:hypothetical protein [Acidimicrobiales bacterium]